MADVKVLLLFCTAFCSLSAALDDDFRGPSPVDPEAADQGESVGQVWEEVPHDHSLDEEALFSPEGKRKLYSLPPEEAKIELRKLIDRIDTDGNQELSREEMIAQLERVDRSYFKQDLEQRWPQVDLDGDGFVTRKEYLHSVGQEDDMEEENLDEEERNDRFKQADSNGDGRLNKAEFDALLHPDLHEHMVQHLIEDHLALHDTDHDGVISFDEYMALYAQTMEGGQMPDWVLQEQKEFREVFDKNGDGKLDREEMKDWIAPSSALYAAEEADHILRDADKNKDGVLTMEEIMDKFELFRDSELTDVWHVGHDEL